MVALLSFSPHILLMQPDDGAPEPAAPADDYYCHPECGYYYKLADDQE
jgi:hypothetical protein